MTDITYDKECTGTDNTHDKECTGTDITYHTDRTLHSTRNVQGQTHIKVIFNFVQGQTLTQTKRHCGL